MEYTVTLLPSEQKLKSEAGSNLLKLLRDHDAAPEAPCGGKGSCGKCLVTVNGKEQLACQTVIDQDLTVICNPRDEKAQIITGGISCALNMDPLYPGYLVAVDIGTTTVVCYLLNGSDGRELSVTSMLNPQAPFGADVITRIQTAQNGEEAAQTKAIRDGLCTLILKACKEGAIEPSEISVISVVGNPCMQQLFMGINTVNLVQVPFLPEITHSGIISAKEFIPICENAVLLIVPDISGYIGGDTMGCILSTRLFDDDRITLMIDIGTNGEMVLGNRSRMIACSTAAGPALEGAHIRMGMRGAPGAIDHVWSENGELRISVIGREQAKGICGSGLIDAVAFLLQEKIINKRGRIALGTDCPRYADRLREVDGQRAFYLTDSVYLAQDDIREVQMAKGAIAAGITLMTQRYGLQTANIDRVLLAGAFGSYIRPESACAIKLLPPELLDKIAAVGNAAGAGAKLLVCNQNELSRTENLVSQIEFLELAALPEFQHTFARAMNL